MDDASAMRPVEGVGNLNRVLKTLIERQRAGHQPIGQRLAFEGLHDEKGDRRTGPLKGHAPSWRKVSARRRRTVNRCAGDRGPRSCELPGRIVAGTVDPLRGVMRGL